MSQTLQFFDDLRPEIEAALRESIGEFGVLLPVVYDQHGTLIDGNQRVRVATEMQVPFERLVIQIDSDEDRARIATTLNAVRRQLSADERKVVAQRLRERGHSLRAIAGALGVNATTVMRDAASGSGVAAATPDNRVVGRDGKTYPARQPAKVIALNERQQAQAQSALVTLGDKAEGTMTSARAASAARVERPKLATPALPEGVYRTIVADPPWAYDEGWPEFADKAGDDHARLELPYQAMTLDEIKALPVASLAGDDAHLFLWTTNRYLRDSYDVLEAWGFEFSQVLVWAKPPRGIGPGGVFSNSAEFVLYGRRGKPEHLARVDSTWWTWPRARHSAKPEAFQSIVETVCGGPYLEMFARRERDGWFTWGLEA